MREAVDLLAAQAPSLTAALWHLARNGHNLGILDGTVVRLDRVSGTRNRLYYSGKHGHHGVNLQGLVDPRRGDLLWISDGLPGSTHDLTAARHHGLLTAATVAEIELLADKGYQGAGGTLISPHKGRKLTKTQRAHNRMVNSIRGPGERLRSPQDLAHRHQSPILPTTHRRPRQRSPQRFSDPQRLRDRPIDATCGLWVFGCHRIRSGRSRTCVGLRFIDAAG